MEYVVYICISCGSKINKKIINPNKLNICSLCGSVLYRVWNTDTKEEEKDARCTRQTHEGLRKG